MISRLNKILYVPSSNKRGSKLILGLVIVAFVFVLGKSVLNRYLPGVVTGFVSPFYKASEVVGDWFYLFESKATLEKENDYLKQTIKEQEIDLLMTDILRAENQYLKEMMSQKQKDVQYILSSVISRPPKSPYDILVVDAGFLNGVEIGMKAVAYNNVIVGYVSEVYPNTSKIAMVSFYGQENDAMIMPQGIAVTAIGKGSENMEIVLPRSVEITSGNQIMTVGTYPFLIGVAERVELDATDPFQKIIFRSPVNVQELKNIMIVK